MTETGTVQHIFELRTALTVARQQIAAAMADTQVLSGQLAYQVELVKTLTLQIENLKKESPST